MNDGQFPGETLSLDALLAHQGFLTSLARSLTRSDQEAEDLVQDAWVGALQGPAPRGPLRHWLAAILRNAWRNLARHEGERAWREAQARTRAGDEETSSPEHVVRELDLRQRILDAVRALPEPHRTTIFLRYYSGLSPREIAQRTGVPLETTRSRLQRGRELLRLQLDRDFGSRAAWSLALGALTGERGAPLAGQPPPVAPIAAGASALGPAVWTALALAVAGSALLVWGLGSARGGSRATLAQGPAPALASERDLAHAAANPERVPAAHSRGRSPAAGQERAAHGASTSDAPSDARAELAGEPTVGREGTARRLGPRAAALRRGLGDAHAPSSLDSSAVADGAVLAPEPGPPRAVRGRLRTVDGSSPAGWNVAIRNPSRGVQSEQGHVSAESLLSGEPLIQTVDRSGSFRFEGLLDRTYDLIAWDPESLQHTLLRGVEPDGGELALAVGGSGEPGRIAGRLSSRSGAPLAGAAIRPALLVGDEGLGSEFLERWVRGPAALTDADGRFELHHPAAFPLRLIVEGEMILLGDGVFDLEHAPHPGELELTVPVRCEITVELHTPHPPAELLAFLGEQDRRMWIQIGEEDAAAVGDVRFWRALPLWPGPQTRTIHVSEEARHLLLFDWNGEEIDRRPIAPDPARATILRW